MFKPTQHVFRVSSPELVSDSIEKEYESSSTEFNVTVNKKFKHGRCFVVEFEFVLSGGVGVLTPRDRILLPVT